MGRTRKTKKKLSEGYYGLKDGRDIMSFYPSKKSRKKGTLHIDGPDTHERIPMEREELE